jgi:hypothetical protein
MQTGSRDAALPVCYSGSIAGTPVPSAKELATPRELQARTRRAHGDQA